MKKLIILLSCYIFVPPVMAAELVGWLEDVRILPADLLIKAKIDTGAKTTSLNCDCSIVVDNYGEKWVRFSITNFKGKTAWFDKKVTRMAIIKRHFGETQQRPVIQLGLCLGGIYKQTDVNLVDRRGMNYQLLVGRQFLQGTHVVDPGRTYLTNPTCETAVSRN